MAPGRRRKWWLRNIREWIGILMPPKTYASPMKKRILGTIIRAGRRPPRMPHSDAVPGTATLASYDSIQSVHVGKLKAPSRACSEIARLPP
ncbi:hypothetical protein MSG28_000335 [Choristoneura fumiferana]|uniref:Uncharacterized protein n=1 Tax=Choristoneura fumiferana TaxID=7141 RepID=A0ACC0K0C5_CHOFU|nr:hypothetical protein MSG28_000335 [Choristoneura fumiferana]